MVRGCGCLRKKSKAPHPLALSAANVFLRVGRVGAPAISNSEAKTHQIHERLGQGAGSPDQEVGTQTARRYIAKAKPVRSNGLVFRGVLILPYSKVIPSEPLFQSDVFRRISLRVGSCDAGTTVPKGAGARYPARLSLPADVSLLTPRWQGALRVGVRTTKRERQRGKPN